MRRSSGAIIFLASIFQFAIWTTALLREDAAALGAPCVRKLKWAVFCLHPCASCWLATPSAC